jgi:hypothetical protein
MAGTGDDNLGIEVEIDDDGIAKLVAAGDTEDAGGEGREAGDAG